MSPPHQDTLTAAHRVRLRMAGEKLLPAFAKLYSQHVLLSSNLPGLARWRRGEENDRFRDASRLLEAGKILREGHRAGWESALRRAAELLEWLSHQALNREDRPLRLLAAALYQLAGYPARASGLMGESPSDDRESRVLRAFLKAEFPPLLASLVQSWASIASPADRTAGPASSGLDSEAGAEWLQKRVVAETTSSLGILCAALRWGDEPRLEAAQTQLGDIVKMLRQGVDPDSWLLGELCSDAAGLFVNRSLRVLLRGFDANLTENGKTALERYVRVAYTQNKAIAWPSQVRGITRLLGRGSFALCTPTGSGKTTIAELAILQSLFESTVEIYATQVAGEEGPPAPLALYLVPSRALATEVEGKLHRVLSRLGAEQVRVTGLYGGTDWGPLDVWLTSHEKTVLICTFEKAEALMRFIGPLFLERLALVVIDEAHNIQFDGNVDNLRTSESRSLRLESLGSRLLAYLEKRRCRIIALSAVAAGMDEALARWVTGREDSSPEALTYRSTRQLVGRLECSPKRTYGIRYDLLDGADLRFEDTQGSEVPFVPNPVPEYPPAPAWERGGVEKRLRPALLWAAIHMAKPDDSGRRSAVLVSITQDINAFAADFLTLLEGPWSGQYPEFFRSPIDGDELRLWNRCLNSCVDYFGEGSYEYRLLLKGIAVHHGKMPGLLARLLVEVVDRKVVSVVLATSTLSEGVNLPFETVLIPLLRRGQGPLSVREFKNLIGRAGRPGRGTEGRALVLLPTERNASENKNAWSRYSTVLRGVIQGGAGADGMPGAQSSLSKLMRHIKDLWLQIPGTKRDLDFSAWLESTAPLELIDDGLDPITMATEALDSLDGILLSAIVEAEQLEKSPLSITELEEQIKKIWKHSYARVALGTEGAFEGWFLLRGIALQQTIYPDVRFRRRLYRSSLPPRSGQQLLKQVGPIRTYLRTGFGYATWDPPTRLAYISGLIELVGHIPRFRCQEVIGRTSWDWREQASWWLNPSGATSRPDAKKVSSWHEYVGKNLVYRFNWGLGSVLSVVLDEVHEGELKSPRIEEWPLTGLPWVVFWIRDLVTWGTLEPVAACLLSLRKVWTRTEAESAAKRYYADLGHIRDVDELLNASSVREWVDLNYAPLEDLRPKGPPEVLSVTLLVSPTRLKSKQLRVVPSLAVGEILWLDLAGYPLARCPVPARWEVHFLADYDFTLDATLGIVESAPYL